MEKEILEILKSLQKDNQEIKSEVKDINKKLDGVIEQTADLLEFRSDMSEQMKKVNGNVEAIRKDITNVEVITASNWQDIAKLKAVR